jgi:hypothetical protein
MFDAALAATMIGLELHRVLVPRDETGEAEAFNTISYIHLRRHEFTDSLEYARQALALHRHLGNRPGMAEALSHIGRACWELGLHDEASRVREEAEEIVATLHGVTAVDVRLRFYGHW